MHVPSYSSFCAVLQVQASGSLGASLQLQLTDPDGNTAADSSKCSATHIPVI
jgi:hypothetical protein